MNNIFETKRNINPETFFVGRDKLSSFNDGEKNCYLLSNNLGGFSSLTALGTAARHDHGLFISSKKAPNYRVHLVTSTEETLYIDGTSHTMHNARFATRTKDILSPKYANGFSFKFLPAYYYKVEGFEIEKEIVFLQNENTLALRYKIFNHNMQNATLNICPLFRLTDKDDFPKSENDLAFNEDFALNSITENECHYYSNGEVCLSKNEIYRDIYFEYDAKDGRDCIGASVKNISFNFDVKNEYHEFFIIFSDKKIENFDVTAMFDGEIARQEELIAKSGIKNPIGQSLVLASDKFVSKRETTNGSTILAGYPWFSDWGRDTMIAMVGCVIATKRFEEAKNILRTFQKYEKNGLLPNMFPEGPADNPHYNTIDAPLLFINAIYLLYKETNDLDFVKEMYPTMESIVENFKKGTDYSIKMDDDGLISGGEGLYQLTWMDIRFEEILPTPRHGKPVEINAYWYSSLKIMALFGEKLNLPYESFENLAENKVKPAFLEKYWSDELGCLRDLISGTYADMQIRLNQIWALSIPFTMVDDKMAKKILGVVYRDLYTPFGLRSLSPNDKEFKANYGGSHFNRDMAYHQGTVWGFPLGAYYLAYLRFSDDKAITVKTIYRMLKTTEATLYEGCLGQIAEVFSGENPTSSEGCFAQAWSVSEILRVYKELEELI